MVSILFLLQFFKIIKKTITEKKSSNLIQLIEYVFIIIFNITKCMLYMNIVANFIGLKVIDFKQIMNGTN